MLTMIVSMLESNLVGFFALPSPHWSRLRNPYAHMSTLVRPTVGIVANLAISLVYQDSATAEVVSLLYLLLRDDHNES